MPAKTFLVDLHSALREPRYSIYSVVIVSMVSRIISDIVLALVR